MEREPHVDEHFMFFQIVIVGLVSNAGVSSGTVMMDDIAERAPVYGAFYVPPNSDSVRKVCELEPVLLNYCDGTKTGNGCYELQITDLSTGFWPSIDGSLPPDEPVCGYRNEKCDYTTLIVGGCIIIFIILLIICGFFVSRICENTNGYA